jgi:hypothetical protein
VSSESLVRSPARRGARRRLLHDGPDAATSVAELAGVNQVRHPLCHPPRQLWRAARGASSCARRCSFLASSSPSSPSPLLATSIVTNAARERPPFPRCCSALPPRPPLPGCADFVLAALDRLSMDREGLSGRQGDNCEPCTPWTCIRAALPQCCLAAFPLRSRRRLYFVRWLLTWRVDETSDNDPLNSRRNVCLCHKPTREKSTPILYRLGSVGTKCYQWQASRKTGQIRSGDASRPRVSAMHYVERCKGHS